MLGCTLSFFALSEGCAVVSSLVVAIEGILDGFIDNVPGAVLSMLVGDGTLFFNTALGDIDGFSSLASIVSEFVEILVGLVDKTTGK